MASPDLSESDRKLPSESPQTPSPPPIPLMRRRTASTRKCALLALTLLSPLAPGAWAQSLLTGTVLDSGGQPVSGVNIDVLGINGGADPIVANDGTDLNGMFSVTVTPPGTYEVIFFPPAPPVTTSLNLSLPSVVIATTTNLGNVSLEPGVAISATLLDLGGLPLPGVNIDIRVKSTGQDLLLTGDATDLNGIFRLAAPLEQIEVRMNTSPLGTSIAPHSVDLNPTADVDLGDIQLKPGFVVTAIVRDAGNIPIANADYDARDVYTGKKLYTPGDNTNATGFVDFVVPAGVYDFDVCPPPGKISVSDLQADISIAGNHSFGLVILPNGVLMTGTTFSHLGVPTANVDVDVNVSGTGVEIPLCSDNSDASGAYSVIVPPGGNYEVIFNPQYSDPLGLDVHNPVSVGGNTVLNSSLPAQVFYTSTGSGTPGTGGLIPELTAIGGTPRLGNSNYALRVANARGGSKVIVNIGLGACPSLQGWQSDFSTARVRAIVLLMPGAPGTAGTGFGEIPIPLPDNPNFVGLSIYAAARVIDPLAVGGIASTPELCTAIAP